MLALFPKFLKMWRPKTLKIDFSITTLSFDVPSPGNSRKYPHKTYVATCHKLESLGNIFAADLSAFKLSWWAPKTHVQCILKPSAKWSFKVIQGRRFWYQSKARMQLPISHQ